MKKAFTITLLVTFLTGLGLGHFHAARAESHGERPGGVAANRWLPISDDLGIVLDDPAPVADAAQRLHARGAEDWSVVRTLPVKGQLVANIRGTWIAIDVNTPVSGAFLAK
jgi:hypothetical protein